MIARFPGVNTTSGNVRMERVLPSCGCTDVEFSSEPILPGEETVITARLNTVQKRGWISKHLMVFLEGREEGIRLELSGNIEAPPRKHMQKEGGIFSAKCDACHYHPAKGQTGRYLYLAVCASCHGIFKDGVSAPALNPERMRELGEQELGEKLKSGKGLTVMPAFGKEHGGPLEEFQLKSLVNYLREKDLSTPPTDPNMEPLLLGQSLYEMWCAACHGSMRLGLSAPPISYEDLKHRSAEDIRKVIADGWQGHVMKPFALEQGGIFTQEQIDALILYLKSGG